MSMIHLCKIHDISFLIEKKEYVKKIWVGNLNKPKKILKVTKISHYLESN